MTGARVAIIGGGLSGLTAAYRLRQAGIDARIFEADDRLGGRVKTVRRGDYAFDVGASGLLGSYEATADLASDLGLGEQLEHGPVCVAVPRNGVLHVLDTARPLAALRTGLLTLGEKLSLLKLAPALIRAWARLDFENEGRAAALDTETSDSFCRRTLSKGATEYLIGPILRALWQRDPQPVAAVDLLWSLKQFAPSMYVFDGGMELLTTTLAEHADALLGTAILSVSPKDGGVEIRYRQDGEERSESFDRCIIATPPMVTRKIFSALPPDIDDALSQLTYGCSVNVHFGMRRQYCGDVQMIMPPESENPDLTTVVFEDKKGRGRSADGRSAITLFFRDSWSRPRLEAGDNSVISEAIEQAKRAIPEFSERDIDVAHVERWPLATMAKSVGATKAIAAISAYNDGASAIFLAGDYFAPSGVNTAVVSGNRAARQVASSLQRPQP